MGDGLAFVIKLLLKFTCLGLTSMEDVHYFPIGFVVHVVHFLFSNYVNQEAL